MPLEIIPFDDNLEKRVKKELGVIATPELINMLRAGKAAYEHGYHRFISKEKFMEWISKLYDAGQEQKKIREGKLHGAILINSQDVINAGNYLGMYGRKRKYLSAKKRPQ